MQSSETTTPESGPTPADIDAARLQSLCDLNLLETPIEERFERITRLACRLLNVPIAAVTLVDERRQWFKSIRGVDVRETPRQLAFCAHTIQNDQTMIVADCGADSRFSHNPLVRGDPHIAFYAGHPLKSADGSRVGALCAIDRVPREFSAEDVQTLQDLAAIVETEMKLASACMSQQQLIAELETERRRCLLDSLTNIWNRAGILEILRRDLAGASRSQKPVGLLIGDVDHFKRINDSHGHPAGDAVLCEIARRLVAGIRPSDAVGRIGGEEFLVVLPECSDTQLLLVAERIRKRLSSSPINVAGAAIDVTISIGAVMSDPKNPLPQDELIRLADAALYAAKDAGRDHVKLAA